MFKLGDTIHKILKPFTKGTKFENCSACNKRAEWLNNVSTGICGFVMRWIAKLTCPCWYKGFFNK